MVRNFPAKVNKTKKEAISSLTSGKPYITTSHNYLFCVDEVTETKEQGKGISLLRWRLVSISGKSAVIVIFTYTVLTADKESEKEKQTITLLENSMQHANLIT